MASLIIPTDAPAVAGPPQDRWTYADREARPDNGNRYELIDGALYGTTALSNFQRIICIRGMPDLDRRGEVAWQRGLRRNGQAGRLRTRRRSRISYREAAKPKRGAFPARAARRYRYPAERRGDDPLRCDCLPGLAAPLSALFAGAPDTML
jgi:hypothetical protein